MFYLFLDTPAVSCTKFIYWLVLYSLIAIESHICDELHKRLSRAVYDIS